ncbi:class F sortase [Streptomyces bauhiniae]|uniref:class F sortase n=1 Tax=Streptomyces bauhiniae TaxID=2340725 RepID=UPI003656CBF0
MSGPRSRRSARVALSLALAGLLAAGVWAAVTWSGNGGGAADFGAAPRSGAPAQLTPRPAAPDQSGVGPSADASVPRDDGPSPTAPSAPSVPRALSIPRLGVRAAIGAVGVTESGQVEVPADPGRVGWYRFSPAPGEAAGSSVIVGHVDAKGRGLGVLVALSEVRLGDLVRVSRSPGAAADYRVVSRRTVAKKALGATGAFRVDGPAVLTLITCTGPYLADEGGYQNNLVVTAEAVAR